MACAITGVKNLMKPKFRMQQGVALIAIQ